VLEEYHITLYYIRIKLIIVIIIIITLIINTYIYTHHIYTYYRFKEIPMDRHFESKCTTACKQNIFDEIRQVHQFSSTHQVASSCYFRRERREKRSLIPKRIRKKSPFPRPQDCNMETGLLGAFVYLALF